MTDQNGGPSTRSSPDAEDLHAPGSPDRYVGNGTRGVITAIGNESLTVDFDGLGAIDTRQASSEPRMARARPESITHTRLPRRE